MADLGRFGLLGALALAVYAVAAAALGGRAQGWEIVRRGVRALWGVAALEALAGGGLVAALLRRDYSFAYVVGHTRDAQALLYTVTAFWGGMEGSLLLWALVLSAYSLTALRFVARVGPRLLAGVAGVCAGVAVFFLFLLASVASPFVSVPFPPQDGRGMNPRLPNPWMAIPPPALCPRCVWLTVPV